MEDYFHLVPTGENIARMIWQRLSEPLAGRIERVTLDETRNNRFEYPAASPVIPRTGGNPTCTVVHACAGSATRGRRACVRVTQRFQTGEKARVRVPLQGATP